MKSSTSTTASSRNAWAVNPTGLHQFHSVAPSSAHSARQVQQASPLQVHRQDTRAVRLVSLGMGLLMTGCLVWLLG